MLTLDLQRRVLAADLAPTDKLVGLAYALHLDGRTGTARVRQQRIAAECGLSPRTVRRAMRELERVGLIETQRTGRSVIVRVGEGIESGRVERTPVSYQSGHPCPLDGLPSEITSGVEDGTKTWWARRRGTGVAPPARFFRADEKAGVL